MRHYFNYFILIEIDLNIVSVNLHNKYISVILLLVTVDCEPDEGILKQEMEFEL